MVPEPPVPAVPYDQRVTFPKCDNPDEELLDFLRGLGASPELLETAMNSGHLGGLAGDLVLGQGANMTIADVARAAGVEDEKVTSIWRELGLRPEADDPRFGPRDVQAVELLVSASELQVEGAELLRVIGASLARVADAAVALYVQNVEAPASGKRLGQLGLARDLARTMEFTLRIGDTVLGPVLAQHLRDAIARQRTTQEGVSDRVMARMAVGFVDMVGSTQAANQLSSRALLEKVASFEARAFDLASENGGWIVKHVGDEVMFVALSGDVGCELALAMTEEFTASGIQPRSGIAFGEVITFHGDYYGPVVNLAARLTDQAVPGEVLVDTAVRETTGDPEICFEPAGRRQLKGFDEPVSVFSLSRPMDSAVDSAVDAAVDSAVDSETAATVVTRIRPPLPGDQRARATLPIPHDAER
jgi:adenylate cyclase